MPDPEPPAGIIVAGMHRSSTSLVASAFAACGYRLGTDLLPAADDNPKGYFEDRRMHQLHRRLLEAYDTAWDLSPRLRQLREQRLTIPAQLHGEVDRLAAEYRSRTPWVWKNPRATLFLEEWARVFPEAVFVICVRSPGGVVDSMLRRQDRMRISTNRSFYRTRRLMRGLSLWRSYNLVALRFADRHPDRTVIVRVPDDIPLLSRCAGDVYEPKLLRTPRWQVRLPALFALRTRRLHRRLRRLADSGRIEALLRAEHAGAQRQCPPAESGHAMLMPLIGVAASAALSTALDVGYNVAF